MVLVFHWKRSNFRMKKSILLLNLILSICLFVTIGRNSLGILIHFQLILKTAT
ncbi:hypothetical protein QWZ13_11715 [Reinekea marina]|uniref:hypothetical protein n=1 Tax=Reinekea marina TaxID=1310421 RepID=UPI0025B2C2DF|nr:hypothetical protein [Reinekea marina]MDN3649583.1 hypothetical protein [Reinekea marina]